jgi:hypothetical protein
VAGDRAARVIRRHSARAILLDDAGRLVLLRRTPQVLLFSSPFRDGLAVAHFFVTRLVRMDVSTRTGPEFADPSRGAYDPDLFDLCEDALAGLDLRPPEVKEFILANREALLAEAGLLA